MTLISMARHHCLGRLGDIQNFTRTQCCGIREISGLVNYRRSPETAMLAICFKMMGQYPVYTDRLFTARLTPDQMRWRYFIFSQAGNRNRNRYGEQFKAFIETMGFGTVICTETGAINPNSGNELLVYVWTINREALIGWFNGELLKYNTWLLKQHPPTPAAVQPPQDHPGFQLPPLAVWAAPELLDALGLGQQIAGANIAAAGGIRG